MYKNNNPSETLVARIRFFWPCSCGGLAASSQRGSIPPPDVAHFRVRSVLFPNNAAQAPISCDPLWFDLSSGLGKASQSVACVERHDGMALLGLAQPCGYFKLHPQEESVAKRDDQTWCLPSVCLSDLNHHACAWLQYLALRQSLHSRPRNYTHRG
jgi:hypothetical protein